MPIFQYTAMDSNGKEKKGRMDAENEQASLVALTTTVIFLLYNNITVLFQRNEE